MNNWLDELSGRIGTTSPGVLIRELDLAFAEAPDLPAAVREWHDLLRFCRFDAIAPWLRDERDVLQRAQAFARRAGEDRVADILAAALAGEPQPPVTFSVTLPGGEAKPLDVDAGEVTRFDGKDWGSTDLALSFAIAGFEEAVLREVLAVAVELDLQPPFEIRQRQQADAAIGARLGGGRSAADLLVELVSARKPTMLAGSWGNFETRVTRGSRAFALEHVAFPPASAKDIARMEKRFGAAAQDILAVHARHDGADLFCHQGEPGFCLVPMAQWQEVLDEAIMWATEVTWGDAPEEIPSYLDSAIAFGVIPGDSEKWLFITEGEHAGKVMLSDTDLIDDQPRFASLAEFFATLLADPPRILNSGGHVRYYIDDEDYFPIAYRPEGG